MFAANSFNDVDVGDVLSYTATLANGDGPSDQVILGFGFFNNCDESLRSAESAYAAGSLGAPQAAAIIEMPSTMSPLISASSAPPNTRRKCSS